MEEIKISRNGFYSDRIKTYPGVEPFLQIHASDWKFTPEKLQRSISKSKKTQMEVAENIGICHVTINIFLKGKQRPTRKTGDYDKIKSFCKKWFEY